MTTRTPGPPQRQGPPGWPEAVRPPGAPQWERTAVAWLLDLCPPDYRAHPVLQRHPQALVHLAHHHVVAALDATRRARAGVRAALTDQLPPPALVELLEALDLEEVRLVAAARGLVLLQEALAGKRYVPRL